MIGVLSPTAIYAPSLDRAVGDEADRIRSAIATAFEPGRMESYKGGFGSQPAILAGLTTASRTASPEAISAALELLSALPSWVPAPEFALEADGQIGFDWYVAKNRTLSLNVGRGGMIGYAFGHVKAGNKISMVQRGRTDE